MINKITPTIEEALADIPDGATIMIGGFGTAGQPTELIDGLIALGRKELTIVNNNAGNGDVGLAALSKQKSVRKIICSFPRQADSYVFDALYMAGEIELELPKEIWRNASALPAPASVVFSHPPATARSSPKARKRARSTAACTCSKRRFTPTSR